MARGIGGGGGMIQIFFPPSPQVLSSGKLISSRWIKRAHRKCKAFRNSGEHAGHSISDHLGCGWGGDGGGSGANVTSFLTGSGLALGASTCLANKYKWKSHCCHTVDSAYSKQEWVKSLLLPDCSPKSLTYRQWPKFFKNSTQKLYRVLLHWLILQIKSKTSFSKSFPYISKRSCYTAKWSSSSRKSKENKLLSSDSPLF